VIAKKIVDRYAHQSGARDQLIAEREVVLTYALHALHEAKILEQIAFKGGTCLRKVVFGSTGRFSEDLDFTLASDDKDAALIGLYEVLNRTHCGITFSIGSDYYETVDGFGMEVAYAHDWNSAGRFRLQVSTREKPTLVVEPRAMVEQIYFADLEFAPFAVPALHTLEMTAEKIRAAFQRVKVRDLYDLHLLGPRNLDGEVLRRLVVLKLWQVKDPFDPSSFFDKLRGGDYDWADLQRLLRPADKIEPNAIIEGIELRFAALRQLTELERQVIEDARSGWNKPLAERLRGEIRERVTAFA
jgi:predicted nucleotidyltransferase component of viral defense system